MRWATSGEGAAGVGAEICEWREERTVGWLKGWGGRKKRVFVTGWNQSPSFIESTVWPLAWSWGYGHSSCGVLEEFTS